MSSLRASVQPGLVGASGSTADNGEVDVETRLQTLERKAEEGRVDRRRLQLNQDQLRLAQLNAESNLQEVKGDIVGLKERMDKVEERHRWNDEQVSIDCFAVSDTCHNYLILCSPPLRRTTF